jgi:hypothetical protein
MTNACRAAGPGTPVTRHGSGASTHLVDVRPWELRWTDFVIRRPLGAGSFGKVYLADLHNTPVAVKVLLDAASGDALGGDQAGAAALSISSPMLAGLVGVSGRRQGAWGRPFDRSVAACACSMGVSGLCAGLLNGRHQVSGLDACGYACLCALQEAGVLASLRHPNCVAFMGYATFPPCIVTEYCARGSLTDVLQGARTRGDDLGWPLRVRMVRREHAALGHQLACTRMCLYVGAARTCLALYMRMHRQTHVASTAEVWHVSGAGRCARHAVPPHPPAPPCPPGPQEPQPAGGRALQGQGTCAVRSGWLIVCMCIHRCGPRMCVRVPFLLFPLTASLNSILLALTAS